MAANFLINNAFCWYPFKLGASVLEVSGGIDGAGKYDVIICADPERPCAGLFANLAEHLNPDGRLLVALYNKYALKYWCGACGGEGGRAFGEIEGGGIMLSGAELRRELEKAGFHSRKWYYPMPDHRYPKAVYSENKPPDRFFATISPMQTTDGAGVLLREAALMPGVIENGAFTFMCDSFIVEAARETGAIMCPVDFAALTLSRPTHRAFVTAVYSDGTATKTAVYPEGAESLRKLAENHARLISRGIEAVPLTLEGSSVLMPAVPYETLWEYMQRKARDGFFDRAEFLRFFDRLRDDILKSSEQSPPGSHGWDAAFGPVLEHAYTEMIPANCFYDNAREAFIYFDQEHSLDNTPYSVPLSRALMSVTYSPELSSHPELISLLEELKERYGLSGIWDRLVEIEREFINCLITGTETARTYGQAVGRANVEISKNRRAHNALAAVTILLRKNKSVGVYGYGKRGRRFAAALELLGASPAFIADAKTGGLPSDAAADVIVVTPKDGAGEIADELRRVTDIPVITQDEIFIGWN